MISERFLAIKDLPSVEAFYEQTTQYYVSGRHTQARNNILVMGKQQIKAYFFIVLALYPDDREFLEFVMAFI